MPTYTIQIISPSALFFNSGTGAFELIPSYDPNFHNLIVTVTDGDAVMNNDDGGDGTPVDTNQTATITDMSGNIVASGLVTSPACAEVDGGAGGSFFIDRIEVDGVHYGYSTSATPTPGQSYPVLMSSSFEDNHTYFESNAVRQGTPACFVSGTLLLTRDGPMPVDWITEGDDLWTQDHGWQTVRWRGLTQFGATPDFQNPIEIQPGALGPDTPADVLRVSPQHHLLLSGPQCELWFGTEEVLVTAKHLLHWPGIARVMLDADYAYHYFLFDRHEVLTAGGVGCESLHLGPQVSAMPSAPSWTVARTLRDGHRQTARLCLTEHEARVLPPGRFPATLVLPEAHEVKAAETAQAHALAG